jgi:hypothetical protein
MPLLYMVSKGEGGGASDAQGIKKNGLMGIFIVESHQDLYLNLN